MPPLLRVWPLPSVRLPWRETCTWVTEPPLPWTTTWNETVASLHVSTETVVEDPTAVVGWTLRPTPVVRYRELARGAELTGPPAPLVLPALAVLPAWWQPAAATTQADAITDETRTFMQLLRGREVDTKPFGCVNGLLEAPRRVAPAKKGLPTCPAS